jgi:peptidyl-prolyl cis-trans isomerase SurA
MNFRAFGLLAVLLAASAGLAAQSPAAPEAVLFRVGDVPVTLDEFAYVYRKNNPSKQDDYSRASLEEYLELYINFKLKVTEARALRIDTLPGVRSELDRYRRQLVKSYFDKAVTDGMAEQAYDRMRQEIEVSHIMVSVQPNAAPEDTLKAWKEISALRRRLEKGEDFADVAKAESDDPNARENGGYLGFMSGLSVADQSFEDALFNTPKGRLSPIVRTRYGYHVVKPGERRTNPGTVTVAHLLVKVKDADDDEGYEKALAETRALRDSLNAGADWDRLVALYSDDKPTARRGGLLEPFGTGKMVDAFEQAAFALEEDGQISEPVRTAYGWHLIKRVSRDPLGGYDELKPEIMRRLQRAGRYDEAREAYVQRAQRQYGFTENDSVFARVRAAMDSSLLVNTWRARKLADRDLPLFRLGNTAYTTGEFADHVEASQRAYRERDIADKLGRLYDQFVEEMTIEYALGRRDEGFRRLLQEYRDGILLFELTEDKVWQEAMRDSTGLAAFHADHADRYLWDERVDATIFTVTDAKVAKKARKMAGKGASPAEIRDRYNEEGQPATVIVESGLWLPGQNDAVDAAGTEPGLSDNTTDEAGNTVFVRVNAVVPPTPKTLDEAKGYVISDYQEYLEQRWVEELRAKYPVTVNEAVFETLIR